MSPNPALVASLLAALLTARAAAELSAQPVVRDSAGIRVVTHERVPPGLPTWRLADAPVLSIGDAFGAAAFEFSRIRGAVPHRGGVLVADGASAELRLFDERGRHVRTVGGRGSGPGEFQVLEWLQPARGDSVHVWDLRLTRRTVLDPELRTARTEPLRLGVTAYVVAGAFDDGTLVVWPFGVRQRQIPAPQLVIDTSYLAIVRAGGALDTVVRLPAQPTFVDPGASDLRQPFTAGIAYALSGRTLWAGIQYELARYDHDGRLQLLVRLPSSGAVTSTLIEAFRAARLRSAAPAQRAELARLLDRVPFPSALPAFDLVRTASDGSVWVRRFPLPGASADTWWILNPDGQLLASIALPAGLLVTAVTADRVYGVQRDDLDVERVVVYAYTGHVTHAPRR